MELLKLNILLLLSRTKFLGTYIKLLFINFPYIIISFPYTLVNVPLNDVADSVKFGFQLVPTFITHEDGTFKNILLTLVTLLVSKLDKSNEVNDEQLLNIAFISVTLLVSKLDTSNEVNGLQ